MRRRLTVLVVVTVSATTLWVPARAGICPSGWAKVDVPVAGSLYAAASISSDDVWVAGFDDDPRDAVAAHWDGSEWSDVPVVVDSGSQTDMIRDMDSIASDDVWFVGGYTELGAGTFRALVLRWTGSDFEQIPIDAGQDPSFYGVEALASDDVWAVGTYWPGSGFHQRGLAAHWDGVEWTLLPIPHRPGTDRMLWDVAAVASDDVWAVGVKYDRGQRPFIVHWDGTTWSTVKGADVGTEQAGLFSVDVAGDAIVAAGYRNDGRRALIEAWTGSSWVRQPVPKVGVYAGLQAVDGSSSDRIWAVGYSAEGPLALRWDGASWTWDPTAQTSRSFVLEAVATEPSGEVVAAGRRTTSPYVVTRCDAA